MDFLQESWESVLRQQYLYDYLTLFLNHPELLEDDDAKEIFSSLKTQFENQTAGTDINCLKSRELTKCPLSREEALLKLLEWVRRLQKIKKSFE